MTMTGRGEPLIPVPFEPADLIYLNTSVSHIAPTWLDGLRQGGRLILPIGSRRGFQSIESGPMDLGRLMRMAAMNAVFRVERRGDEFYVRPSVPGGFIPAHGGARDAAAADAAVAAAFEKGRAKDVTLLYRDEDIPEERVWLKGEGWCLAYG